MSTESYFRYPFLDTAVPNFVDRLIDEDGRPLAEANAPRALLAGVDIDYQPCPHSGSRRGAQMNVSALKQVTSCWPDCLEDLVQLRSLFMQSFPMEMNYLLLSRLGNFLTSVPGFLVRRGVFSWNSVPRSLSALFKASQGLYLTANAVIVSGSRETASLPVRTDEFLQQTEDRLTFWNDGKVCAGPPAMIRRFVDIAIEGRQEAVRKAQRPLWDLPANGLTSYAEMKLQAQLAKWVFEARLDDALGLTDPGSDNMSHETLEALDRQSGLRLGGLVREREWNAPAAEADGNGDHRTAERIVAIAAHYARYLQARQARLNKALGIDRSVRFEWQAYADAVGHYGDNSRKAALGRILDPRKLARLVDAAVGVPLAR
ncbi:hypothetical protein JQ620_09325 [Bradyrhizobium sp. AUGA SZCCT0274]|uniref:hypothetical protein n=1 Tax=Bradyrhizobium sp. AUGA SZCCT0274 TaxID=2807670 RepID=UPI001BA60380|nr:hypothetical protein [Bradyrhizobium sp. AUGA SZCCT0274]MBR1240325.1 hypothetical protein [Bradyrhizobium sp. AUGA SZCCT0274]